MVLGSEACGLGIWALLFSVFRSENKTPRPLTINSKP